MINQIRYFIGNSKCYTVRIVAYNSFVILYFLGQKLHASCLQGTFFSCFRKGGNIKEIYISIDNGETTCFLLSRCPIVNNVAIVGGVVQGELMVSRLCFFGVKGGFFWGKSQVLTFY